MSAENGGTDESRLLAYRCPDGHLTCPAHPVCPTCGSEQTGTVDLTDETGEVVTWTTSVATPSGVRAPNTLAIVSFSVDGETVQVLGGTTDDVGVGDAVRPVFVDRLRDPAESLRAESSQDWSGFRFGPVE